MGEAYPPIGEYALLGDCHSAALVSRDGHVDWWCPPRFDAPAVLCRMLDLDTGGYFRVAPTAESAGVERSYRGFTNVLDTTWSVGASRARVTDLLVVHVRQAERQGYDVGASHRLLRLVEGLSGEVDFTLDLKPAFDFGRARHQVTVHDDGAVANAGGSYLALACRGVRLEPVAGSGVRGSLRVRSGERYWVVLTYVDNPDRAIEALAPANCDDELTRTVDYWERWSAGCDYQGPYRESVVRSALVLKLLTYEPTGAVVAAPTTSLPEVLGGKRNWDYRFSWLRDASIVLYALLTLGKQAEAADYMHWLEATVGDDVSRPQIMYGIDGRRTLDEERLEHLDGYCGSRPVRVGNAAYKQRQLDIYGEVLRAAALHYVGGTAPRPEAWRVLRGLADDAATHWSESGSGIWEVRGGPKAFLYGKLMCWSALDTAIDLALRHGLDSPLDRWQASRDQIRAAILDQGYNAQVGAFTESFGSSVLDASALVLPRVGFLAADDPRMQSTVDQIRRQLVQNGLVYRYRAEDGLEGSEGTFTLCTFWLVDALSLQGRIAEARELFEGALARANDLGLLAEELDPNTGQQLGNFPQGFSHAALIGAAVNLARAEREGGEHHPLRESERATRATHRA